MVCTTIRVGYECPFMTAKGCSYNGGICHEIVGDCDGCNRVSEYASRWYCSACPDPSLKWKNGDCNMASHVTRVSTVKNGKLNPLKASKRGNR